VTRNGDRECKKFWEEEIFREKRKWLEVVRDNTFKGGAGDISPPARKLPGNAQLSWYEYV
jgi:hypothetical protein